MIVLVAMGVALLGLVLWALEAILSELRVLRGVLLRCEHRLSMLTEPSQAATLVDEAISIMHRRNGAD